MRWLVLAVVLTACEADVTPTTAVLTTTTPTTTTSTTTTVPETTTTVSEEQRIAEVTEIVREVEFGWFDAIYRKDEAALHDVVARQESIDTALGLMSNQGFFTSAPTLDGLVIEVRDVLIDRADCLAVAFHGDANLFRGPGAASDLRAVFWPRPSDGTWRRAYQGDEWQAACDDFTREGQLP